MHLEVVTHHQEENDYCGPACAQMVMQYRSRTAPLQQNDLFTTYCNEPNGVGISSKPTGLHWTISQRVPDPVVPDPYQPRVFGDAETLSQAICHSIGERCEPATVMVCGIEHWLVVSGYDVDASGPIGIKSFSLNDPADVRSKTFKGCQAKGLITYEAWLKSRVNDVPGVIFYPESDPAYVPLKGPVEPFTSLPNDALYANAFAAILDDSPSSGVIAATCDHAAAAWDLNPGSWAAHDASNAATAIFFSATFPEIEPWHTLRQTGVEALGPAQSMDYFDGNDGKAWFTPFRWSTSSGKPGVPMIIIWEGERLFEATATIQGSLYLADDFDMFQQPHDVYKKYAKKGFEFTDRDGNLQHYIPAPSNFVPDLWWRHSMASVTPFLPFYRFYFPAEAGRDEHTFYVRLDGKVLSDLHDGEGNILESGMIHER